ncbi:hypothetical protein COV12_03355 [Candidatus Woesearchaeota archaeon CG10_big_fil_rev_8_21_14_0_10_32_24]|nr:MAG: hypothetical protein COV12_03355 [Candidatus Woesearchaeota archaeon CG10_big_fil_rev_8_21_14_0_10_32_24]
MEKKTNYKLFKYGIMFIVIISLFNVITTFNLGSSIDNQIAISKEKLKPAKIATIILTSTCANCFDISTVKDTLKSKNVEFIKELSVSRTTTEGKKLIEQYNIKKLPTLIVKGEVDKLSLEGFVKSDDALIFENIPAPYQDALTGNVKGNVKLTMIKDKKCTICTGLDNFVNSLKQVGISISDEKNIDVSEQKGKDLIESLKIMKLPAILISEDIEEYPISQNLEQAGIKKIEGTYVVESLAPYVEVNTGKIRGSIELVLVSDKDCEECYDVNIHQQIFGQMGMAIENIKSVDISSSEGIRLKEKYNLVNIPTLILKGDLAAYQGFDQIWKNVGTIETNGDYVFRNIEQIGQGIVYKNLETGEIVKNTSPTN